MIRSRGRPLRVVMVASELQPAMFVEVSPELAAERGLQHLGWAHVVTARSAVEARVMVTDRLRPLLVQDREIHQIWLPYHFGSTGLVTGDESKAGTCDIRPGRRPTGPALLAYLADYRRRAGLDAGHHAPPLLTSEEG